MGVAAVAVLALAACGDDDDGGGGAASGTDAAPATTTASSGGADTTTGATTSGSGGGGGGEGRELIIARDMDLTTLDPSRAYCDTCQIYLSAVYQTLIGVDPTDLKKLLPRLATKWEANADNTVFTFTLDPKAVFADGSPVTAADVKFSWERLAGLEGSASYLMAGVKTVEAPDDLTVVATFDAPNSAFLNIVSAPYMSIMSKAQAEANGATARRRGRRRAVVPRQLGRQWPVPARVLRRERLPRAGPQRRVLGHPEPVPVDHPEAGQGRHRPAATAAAGRRRHRHADQLRLGRPARRRRRGHDRGGRLVQLRVRRAQPGCRRRRGVDTGRARGDQARPRLRRASSTRPSAGTASCRRRRSRTDTRARRGCRCRSRTSRRPSS